MHPTITRVTERITKRSETERAAYLARIHKAAHQGPARQQAACSNLAHAMAASSAIEKQAIANSDAPNIGIITAYNDMLSAHQPFESYPARIKLAAAENGAVSQVAGGVPAMCDGVTQGQEGMDLSLFSRDVIALSTAVALSHDVFDGAILLGICDKIVPGMLIGALSFGHLPVAFAPAGPMVSGLSNKDKALIREDFAAGRIDRKELLEAESAAYHAPGTCTFYGTANSNQMLMELMGLQLPGGSFVNPDAPLRDHLTDEVVRRVVGNTSLGDHYVPVGEVVSEKAVVNSIVGLLATGGSTNHTIHLIAIARAAGITIDWEDFSELSTAVPLLARVYPNGLADVNHFHAAGGMGLIIRELLQAGLLHDDVTTILGQGLSNFCDEPFIENGGLAWRAGPETSLDSEIIATVNKPFDKEGGLRLVKGNVGRAVVKLSAVDSDHHQIEAPAKVFASQDDFKRAFNDGELEMDFVAVLPHQGPSAIGMPELHKLTPYLGLLQNRGFKVALLTDGRMSGASGKVLAAIHATPEAARDGLIGKIRDGDMVTIDSAAGELQVSAEDNIEERDTTPNEIASHSIGIGRELFQPFRERASSAEEGASFFA
ncbi:MAG: phosphogluconate dehydratase [Gammaproteobacteria bacterium]|jgi:phosphogluconate dehydratase|nr:phosphogluconate dehydratase [Gammaproteobacteria bacterium]